MNKRSRKTLSEILSRQNPSHVCNSCDIVGDITIIRLRESSKIRRRKIAEALMGVHKKVKTVLAQTGAVCGDFRLRKLEYVADRSIRELRLCVL